MNWTEEKAASIFFKSHRKKRWGKVSACRPRSSGSGQL